ncbi:MAG: anaerobic ribonucleoside-triphosphate reductase activating protein [Eubacteriales bacterium]
MIIKGLQKTTLLDYPGKVACTVFAGGCNFRCPFCHNASIVLTPNLGENMSFDELFAFLEKRRGILEGVCITGGEPLLDDGVFGLMRCIRDMGLCVKLDTNGSFPDRLEYVIENRLVDYVAMDIKNSPAKYAVTCGADNVLDRVLRSVDILLDGRVDFEFRTTVVRELHAFEDFHAIGEWIRGARRYFLQSFKDSGDIIGGDQFSAYDTDDMEKILAIVREYIPSAQLRGI